MYTRQPDRLKMFHRRVTDLLAGLLWLRYPREPCLPQRDQELWRTIVTDRERAVNMARRAPIRGGALPSEEFPESLKPAAEASAEELYRRLDYRYNIAEMAAKRAIGEETMRVRKQMDILFATIKKEIMLWTEMGTMPWYSPEMLKAYQSAIDRGGPETAGALERVIRDLEQIKAKIEYAIEQEQTQSTCTRGEGSEAALDGDDTTAKGMTWRDVQGKLLGMVETGEPYASIDKLARKCGGCSSSTVHKAINKTPRLKAWQAQHAAKSPKAQGLNDVVLDSAKSNEDDPAKAAANEELDTVFAKLLQEATPAERAGLNARTLEERRELAQITLEQQRDQHVEDHAGGDDNKHGNKLLGRKP